MANPPQANPEKYFSRNAFERLMMLIATLVRVPGVGYLDREETDSGQHSALEEVHRYVLETAEQQGVTLSKCGPHSLHRDLKALRDYGILDQRMYRWGYFLGTGALNPTDMAMVLNVLHSQASYQRDPQIKHLYERLSKRLKGAADKESLFYPVRAQWNRSIVEVDPVERMGRGLGPRSLLDALDVVEEAILNGQALELCRQANPFGDTVSTKFQAWPLQLLHYDIAWYLIYQYCNDNHLAVSRIDRLSDDYRVLTDRTRSLDEQRRNLKLAHELLENGWGLLLGKPEDQRLELQGKLEQIQVRVRFYPKVMGFIAEGALRHPSQKIQKGPLDPATRKPAYLDYIVTLPMRSIQEFSFWVYRFMGNAQVIAPDWLAQQHLEAASKQVAYYTRGGEV
jgi:hypothetical protein